MEHPNKPVNNSTSPVTSLKLSTHQFGKILDSLRSSGSPAGSDKRRFNRMEVEAKLPLANLVEGKIGKCYVGLTRDISINGVGLFQCSPLVQGELFLASMPLGKEELVLTCKTTFCRMLAEGIYAIGAEFAAATHPQLLTPSAAAKA